MSLQATAEGSSLNNERIVPPSRQSVHLDADWGAEDKVASEIEGECVRPERLFGELFQPCPREEKPLRLKGGFSRSASGLWMML